MRDVKLKNIYPLQRTELRVVSCLWGPAISCHVTSPQTLWKATSNQPVSVNFDTWLTCSQSYNKNHWKANFPLHMQQNLICTYDLSVKTHWACSTYLFLGQVLQVIIIEAFTPLPIWTQPQGSCTQNSRDILVHNIALMLKHSFWRVLNSDKKNLLSWWYGQLGYLGWV